MRQAFSHGLGWVASCLAALLFGLGLAAQTPPANPAYAAGSVNGQAAAPPALPAAYSSSHRFGIGIQASTLGPGVQFAARVLPKLNFRVGFNDFSLSHNLNKDGIGYTGHLSLRSVEAHADWFFWGPLHLSPGVLLYDGNKITGNAAVPGGDQFTLGGTTYTSSTANPVSGNLLLNTSHKVAPMITVGIGNLVPRNKHFGISFEIGAAYQGTPQVALAFQGDVCDPNGANCQSTSNPSVQANVQAEQTRLENDVKIFKWYPIIAAGFHYAF